MSNNFVGTPEQDKAFDEVLRELETVPGPLMKALQKAQEIYGYLPIEVQTRIADKFDVPLEEIYGIATFYSQFKLEKKGKYEIGVCLGTACYVKGSGDVLNKLKEKLGVEAGSTTADNKFSLAATRCIGCCGLAPVMTVNEDVYGKVTVDELDKILAKYND